jgi:hypothetical protein
MFTSEKVVDVTPRLLFSSESDEAGRKELEVDLTDQNLGIGSLVPTSDIDNSFLLEDRVEDAKGVDLSGCPAHAVVRKLKANGFLELGHYGGGAKIASSTRAASLYTLARRPKPVVRSLFAGTEFSSELGVRGRRRRSDWWLRVVEDPQFERKDVAVAWLSHGCRARVAWQSAPQSTLTGFHLPRPDYVCHKEVKAVWDPLLIRFPSPSIRTDEQGST